MHGTTSLQDIATAQLLIEAIPERLELKHALYAQLEALIAPDAVIASNTSGLPPDALGRKVLRNVKRRRMRFRLRVAKPDQRLAVVLHDVLPAPLHFAILRDYYGKGGQS